MTLRSFRRWLPISRGSAVAAVLGLGALVFGGCARNDSYFGDRQSSRLSGPIPTAPTEPMARLPQGNSEPFGTYRGGRDPRTGLASSAPPWQPAYSQQVETLPQTASTQAIGPAAANLVTVQSGDTLYGLAKKHHVSISALMAMNKLSAATIQPLGSDIYSKPPPTVKLVP